MKTKFFFIALMMCLGMASISSLSGCTAGARIGPVGAGASVG